MGGFRSERIAEMIHRELAQRMRQLKDPNLVPVSITRVEVTRDLSIAKISWLPFGGMEPADTIEEALERAAKQLRGPIGRALRLRHAPELRFEPDAHTEAAMRVTQLLSRLERERHEEEE
jgi:ribosome-binding factor A